MRADHQLACTPRLDRKETADMEQELGEVVPLLEVNKKTFKINILKSRTAKLLEILLTNELAP